MISIKDYLIKVYEDFSQYVDEENELCILKTLNYQKGMTPDYNDIHIQQLYLLRYAFSYAFEYKSMFGTLFAREKYVDSINVASIGCGSMIDYWALVGALEEFGVKDCKIIYRGVDCIDWNYKIEQRIQDKIKFKETNVTSIFAGEGELISDVYIFPKSISEFSDEEFKIVCTGFETKKMVKDNVHVLISIRSDEGSMDRDMDRSGKIISAMSKNGFYTKDKPTKYIQFVDEGKGIKGLDYKFEYPDRAIELIKTLNEQCRKFVENSENCVEECKKYLNRWPVLRAKNIKYQILTFHRKVSV
ncbi:hypothetical protein K040078D81_08220 [Blautia hominis]|uniref:Uncharacterized protein n=1 Tax=Blautia hominis TaxID=2025493 RepID=A0ABQ0B5H2_9FIRM